MRLIDADALMAQFPCTCGCKNCGQGKDGILPCDIKDKIKEAPTAIDCGEKVKELEDAIAKCEQAEKEFKKRSQGEWIPCSERLPEESGQYYVSGGDKVWICDFLIFSNLKGGWCNNVSNPVVEAWMPLPTPYREEGEAE